MRTPTYKCQFFSLVLSLLSVICSVSSYAAGISSFGNFLSSGTSSSKAAIAMRNHVVTEFVVGEASVLKAQSYFALAYGYKKLSAQLRAASLAKGSGATVSMGSLQYRVRLSEQARKKLTLAMLSNKKLTARGGKQFVTGTGFYAIGLAALALVVPQCKPLLSRSMHAISSASFIQALSLKRTLAPGLFLARHTPSYFNGLVKDSQLIESYATKNRIELPSSATSTMDKLLRSP